MDLGICIMNATVLDPVLGPTFTAQFLFDKSKKAIEESMEYQEFILNLNKALLEASEQGLFHIAFDVPNSYIIIVGIHYRAQNINVHAFKEEGDNLKTQFSWGSP